jgi:hypothetical protein
MAKPRNVRIYRPDTDTELPVDLVFECTTDDGIDVWLIANATIRLGVDHVRVGVLPAHTAISVNVEVSGD